VVKFYGLLRRRLRAATVEVAGEDLTVLALLRRTEEQAGQSFMDELLDREAGLLAGTIILINGENIRLRQALQTMVKAGDRLDLFSPAGGG